jgi:predicted RNase H-like HicB family nuclease
MKQEAARLVTLLNDPEEGMFTWHEALNRVMIRLRDLYFEKAEKVTVPTTTSEVAEIMKRWYPVQIHLLGKEDGDPYYFGFLIDWGHSACSATGDTIGEMLENLESVKRNMIDYYLEAGIPIPDPSGDPTEG